MLLSATQILGGWWLTSSLPFAEGSFLRRPLEGKSIRGRESDASSIDFPNALVGPNETARLGFDVHAIHALFLPHSAGLWSAFSQYSQQSPVVRLGRTMLAQTLNGAL